MATDIYLYADTSFMKLIPLFILVFVGGVLACEVREVAPSIEGMQELPDVSHGFVTWINDHRVFGFDGRTNTSFAIDADRYSTGAIVEFPFVFWIGFDEDSQIYSCDLRRNGYRGGCFENDEKHAVTNYLSLKRGLSFSRPLLVWQDHLRGNWDIMSCDLRKNGHFGGCLVNDSKRFITQDPVDQTSPSVAHGFVAWEKGRYGDVDIFGFDVARNVAFPLVVLHGRQHSPIVDGRFVYFGDVSDGNEEIKRIRLSDRIIENVTNSPVDERQQAVDGFIMAYETSVFGASSIGVRDLKKNVSSVIRLNDREFHPKTSDGWVVFEGIANGTGRVYLAMC